MDIILLTIVIRTVQIDLLASLYFFAARSFPIGILLLITCSKCKFTAYN